MIKLKPRVGCFLGVAFFIPVSKIGALTRVSSQPVFDVIYCTLSPKYTSNTQNASGPDKDLANQHVSGWSQRILNVLNLIHHLWKKQTHIIHHQPGTSMTGDRKTVILVMTGSMVHPTSCPFPVITRPKNHGSVDFKVRKVARFL